MSYYCSDPISCKKGTDRHVVNNSAAQGSLRAGLDHAEALIDAVTDRGIVQLDTAGKVVYWSAGARNLLGYSDDEVLGRSIGIVHTDTDRSAGVLENDLAAARQSDRVEFEGWRVRRGGQHFRAAGAISAIRDQTGSLTGFVTVIQDVTADQQRTHPLFFDLLESAPDAMVIVGPEGRIVLANGQTDRMFGYAREELVGSEIEMLLPQRFREDHLLHRMDYVAEPTLRQMGTGLNLWGLRRDGTEFPVDISLSPLRIDQDRYISAAIRDVTRRHEQEQQLRQQHEALLQKQQELEQLARVDALTELTNHAETIACLE
nr:PAS domain S-box protein [Actinomycetes bacterium]